MKKIILFVIIPSIILFLLFSAEMFYLGNDSVTLKHDFDSMNTTIPQTELYSVYEKSFNQRGSYINPYVEVDANVILTSPSAAVVTLPIFWYGGTEWRFRFSPYSIGVWTWVINSDDAGLDGQSGSFECITSTNKGSLVADASYPYHFKYQNGDRIWFLGDTQWNLFRTIPYDSLDTETVKQYIDLRASQGYNVVHFVTNTDEQWLDVEQNDMDSLNLTFFKNGDERIAYLNSKGLVGGLLISWANERGDGTWRDWDNFTTAEQRSRYLRYIVGRYSAYNIYWILAGEFDETTTPVDWDDLGTQLKAYDPHDRMIAVHPGGVETSEEFADLDWAGFGNYQQTSGFTVYDSIAASRDHSKPVVNSEYAYYLSDRDSSTGGEVGDNWYENMPHVRRAAWDIAMAGGYFITGYGATVLGGLRHDWAFTDMTHSRYDDWEEQVGYIKTFFEDLDYWRLNPNDALITSGTGTHHALFEDNSVYIVYAYDVITSFQIDFSNAVGAYVGMRFDPRTGTSTSLGSFKGGDTIIVSVPDTNDYCYKFTRI